MVKCCAEYSAGDLRSKITIQRKTRVADGLGGWTETWASVGTPWAMWQTLSGRELYIAQRINPRVSVKAVIRFKGDADGNPYYGPADRVLFRNRYFGIEYSVNVDDRREWVEMMLSEGAPS